MIRFKLLLRLLKLNNQLLYVIFGGSILQRVQFLSVLLHVIVSSFVCLLSQILNSSEISH